MNRECIKDLKSRVFPFERFILAFTEGNEENFLCTALGDFVARGPREVIPVKNLLSLFSPQNTDAFNRFAAAFKA
jgi:hypothetical protein